MQHATCVGNRRIIVPQVQVCIPHVGLVGGRCVEVAKTIENPELAKIGRIVYARSKGPVGGVVIW